VIHNGEDNPDEASRHRFSTSSKMSASAPDDEVDEDKLEVDPSFLSKLSVTSMPEGVKDEEKDGVKVLQLLLEPYPQLHRQQLKRDHYYRFTKLRQLQHHNPHQQQSGNQNRQQQQHHQHLGQHQHQQHVAGQIQTSASVSARHKAHCEFLGPDLCPDCEAIEQRRQFNVRQNLLFPRINVFPRHMVASQRIMPRPRGGVWGGGVASAGSVVSKPGWSRTGPPGRWPYVAVGPLDQVVTELDLCKRVVEGGGGSASHTNH
jgi:hypothetical protein